MQNLKSINHDQPTHIIIIGAGPAGLTAGYLLSKENINCLVLESNPHDVGGISRTIKYKGFHFDLGGHRFFSKSEEVNRFWKEVLPDDFLVRSRSSKIFYRSKFYSYPLKAFEAFKNLGFVESFLCVLSYLIIKFFVFRKTKTFEDWVTYRFGKRLFGIFFKAYTEKVWGRPCSTISSDWAAQRIKGLDLFGALIHSLIPHKKNPIKTLIGNFYYPRLGPGMMWEKVAENIVANQNEIRLNSIVDKIEYNQNLKLWSVYSGNSNYQSHQLISSMPIAELVKCLGAHLSKEAQVASSKLEYRDFVLVALIIKDEETFTDNWIYINDPDYLVGRVQNFKSWSPYLVPDQNLNCYGLEYFCNEGDVFWRKTDLELIELAKGEICRLGLVSSKNILEGVIVREKKAYPVYSEDYQKNVKIIRNELESKYPSLHLIGRNGLHRYNNQDHAMMTAMLTVKNIKFKERRYCVWNVNEDAEYHEE